MLQSFHGHQGDVMALDLAPSENGNTFVSGVRNPGFSHLVFSFSPCLFSGFFCFGFVDDADVYYNDKDDGDKDGGDNNNDNNKT